MANVQMVELLCKHALTRKKTAYDLFLFLSMKARLQEICTLTFQICSEKFFKLSVKIRLPPSREEAKLKETNR